MLHLAAEEEVARGDTPSAASRLRRRRRDDHYAERGNHEVEHLMVSSQVMARRERVAALLDVSVGRGLEVGPLDSPLATKDVADVRYVDVLDRDGLRDRYASVTIVDGDEIPVIDFPLITSEGRRGL